MANIFLSMSIDCKINYLYIFFRRDGTSWGFSIVGGADPSTDRTEPVHVLFVVPESPAAKVLTYQFLRILRKTSKKELLS